MAEIVIVPDAEAAGQLVAGTIFGLIASKPDMVLGLATGSTPLSVYRALADGSSGRDLSRVRGFGLDEYVGLPKDHPESYRSVIRRDVVEPVGFDPRLIQMPNGAPETIQTAGDDYEAAIRASGGVDLQILGIGTDGHLGFNEPGSSFASLTRVKTLTQQTRRDNSRFFDSVDDVPLHCITQGVGTILRARHLVLLAFGEGKAHALQAAVEGPLTASVPASAVQLHAHATIVVDEAAASELVRADYYRYSYANKPEWQGL